MKHFTPWNKGVVRENRVLRSKRGPVVKVRGLSVQEPPTATKRNSVPPATCSVLVRL